MTTGQTGSDHSAWLETAMQQNLAACSDQQCQLVMQRFQAVLEATLSSEPAWVEYFSSLVPAENSQQNITITDTASAYIDLLRHSVDKEISVESFLAEYSLDTREGLQLMSLAEALVRIPDSDTAEALIESKLKGLDWLQHVNDQLSPLLNAATRALLFGDVIVSADKHSSWLMRLLKKLGEPVFREALLQGMKLLGKQFVLGHDLPSAQHQAEKLNQTIKGRPGYLFSFDMLGEAALSAADATRFFQSYHRAIDFFASSEPLTMQSPANISIKLSALHPRYDSLQQQRVIAELVPRLKQLVLAAKSANVGITIDAEESERLELSLLIFQQLFFDADFIDWPFLGLAVQAYSKRAFPVLRWLKVQAQLANKRIPVRLVKGAYWDREIKVAQQLGLVDYPVFTHKSATDLCYQACGGYLLANLEAFYPQFATHNARTLAELLHGSAGKEHRFELQRLHGMGSRLYQQVLAGNPALRCRVYAPIGVHRELLPYLIRRLLENGASLSFINQIMHSDISTGQLALSPLSQWQHESKKPAVALPSALFGGERDNSPGINWRFYREQQKRLKALADSAGRQWQASPLINGEISQPAGAAVESVRAPYDRRQIVGEVCFATNELVDAAVNCAYQGWLEWRHTTVDTRAKIINKVADGLLEHQQDWLDLLIGEAGKTHEAALAEVREAVDFCRYYAQQARVLFQPLALPGPTGEHNYLQYVPRGVCACISPWNFPLAILLGMISAALMCGNAVVAKPAEQTSLIAYRLITIMLAAGVPASVLQLLPGRGEVIGSRLIEHPRLACVTFTGSFATAQHINRQLAQRSGPMLPLIAETGGQNALIVDSSALPEQVVEDVLVSAFDSAGQRCSALRVLYLQEEIADKVLALLAGALAERVVGNPQQFSTDIGPVIDSEAFEHLQHHCEWLQCHAKLIARVTLAEAEQQLLERGEGFFVAPCIYEIDSLRQLKQEHFGPILHVIRYRASELPAVVDAINDCGYGLTFGMHSRNQDTINRVIERIQTGNVYINRNMVGAVVGSQPFGGMAMSGTGPKAGGPDYLRRLVHEKAVSDNVAAIGGNVQLLVKTDR